jgi:hypothetical protein
MNIRWNTQADVNFLTAITAIVQAAVLDTNLVALVMRWNRNDLLVWRFDSLPVGQAIVPGGGAAHAEEVMLASWGICLAANGGNQPQTVEVFVTQSPCMDRSQARVIGGLPMPAGCCRKFETFIPTTNADWVFSFFKYYQDGVRADAQAYGAVAIIATLNRTDIYCYRDRHTGLGG